MLKKLNDNYIFEEAFVLVLMVFAAIIWHYNFLYGIGIMAVIGAIAMIVFNDFKYMVPTVLLAMFSQGQGIDSYGQPIPLYIAVGLAVIAMVYFTIKNRVDFKKLKSFKGLALLSVLSIIPIFWHNIIPSDQPVMYILYFNYLAYFLVMVLFTLNLNKKSFRMVCIAMSYTAVLISIEVITTVYHLHLERPEDSILSFWYYIGWGICNEAGILMCVTMPFIFIQLVKTEKISHLFIAIFKLCLVCVCIVLTTSRASYAIGALELIALLVWSAIYAKKRKTIWIIAGVTFAAMAVVVFGVIGITNIIDKVKSQVFDQGLDNNGRTGLWKSGIRLWTQNFGTVMFGNGIVGEWSKTTLDYYSGARVVYLVYHCTVIECLASVGVVGLACLAFHFYEKYRQGLKLEKSLLGLILIGYILVDLYGLIDNTYGMYFYMIPLMIIMGGLNNYDKTVDFSY
jgi:hypothetical protein